VSKIDVVVEVDLPGASGCIGEEGRGGAVTWRHQGGFAGVSEALSRHWAAVGNHGD